MTETAPLLDIAESPVPQLGEAAWVRGAGGVRLRTALFRPPGPPRGSVVLSPGRTEPIEKYYELISDLQDRGFVVLAHDWRGQGLSTRDLGDRLKGHARGYKPYLDDFAAVLKAYEGRLPRPWVGFGHSMGGTLTLLALTHGERRFAGAILSAPMLGVVTAPVSLARAKLATWLAVRLGRRTRYVRRGASRPPEGQFDGNLLTHDPRRFGRHRAQLAADPDLALGEPTWGWLDFAFKACRALARPDRLREVTIPVTIVAAEHDKVVDNAAQAAAARWLPQGRLIVVPGAYHELLMETDPMRNIFMRALDALLGRVAPEPAKPPSAAVAPAAKPATPSPTAEVAPLAKPTPVANAEPPAAPPPAAKPAAAKPVAAKPVAPEPAVAKPAAAKPATKAPRKSAAGTAKTPAAPKAPAKASAKASPSRAANAPAAAGSAKTPAKAKPAASKAPKSPKVAVKPAGASGAPAKAAKARSASAKMPPKRAPASKT